MKRSRRSLQQAGGFDIVAPVDNTRVQRSPIYEPVRYTNNASFVDLGGLPTVRPDVIQSRDRIIRSVPPVLRKLFELGERKAFDYQITEGNRMLNNMRNLYGEETYPGEYRDLYANNPEAFYNYAYGNIPYKRKK